MSVSVSDRTKQVLLFRSVNIHLKRDQMKKRFQYLQWESMFRRTDEQKMLWFNPCLDLDFDAALCNLNIHSGTVLDIGTGTGSQAIALAELGFKVTATDISDTAVEKAASKVKEKNMDLVFMQDEPN